MSRLRERKRARCGKVCNLHEAADSVVARLAAWVVCELALVDVVTRESVGGEHVAHLARALLLATGARGAELLAL
jgi:hypothetical protein